MYKKNLEENKEKIKNDAKKEEEVPLNLKSISENNNFPVEIISNKEKKKMINRKSVIRFNLITENGSGKKWCNRVDLADAGGVEKQTIKDIHDDPRHKQFLDDNSEMRKYPSKDGKYYNQITYNTKGQAKILSLLTAKYPNTPFPEHGRLVYQKFIEEGLVYDENILSKKHQRYIKLLDETDKHHEKSEKVKKEIQLKETESLRELKESLDIIIKNVSTKGHELMCMKLVQKIYPDNKMVHTGGKDDEGIDVFDMTDTSLGLANIHVQSSRSNPVPPKEIRSFANAIQLKGTNIGLFITSGVLSEKSKETINNEMEKLHIRIVTIEGKKFIDKLIEHNVCVKPDFESKFLAINIVEIMQIDKNILPFIQKELPKLFKEKADKFKTKIPITSKSAGYWINKNK